MKIKKTHRSSGDDGHPPDDEIDEKLKTYEERLARLFGELIEIGSGIGGSFTVKEPAHSREALETHRQAIVTEIWQVRQKMNELRQSTGRWYQRAGMEANSALDRSRRELEEKKLRMRQQLSKIADAQVALTNEWNKDPAVAKRAEFEKEYRRLAAEFSKVRAELNLIRARLREF